MSVSIIDQNSFVCGVGHDGEHAFLAAVIDEFADKKMPHGILMHWHAGSLQKVTAVKWNVVAMTVLRNAQPCLLALGETGLVTVARPGLLNQEDLGIAAAIGSMVPLRSATVINESVYAVGMRRQAYLRSPEGSWTAIHGSMLAARNSTSVVGFESVVAAAEDEVYAAGWEGEIWRFNGDHWRQLISPTNLIITCLAIGPGGRVYGCGQAGMLAVGRGDSWQTLSSGTQDDLWSIACFKDRLFMSSFQCLYELRDDKLVPVAEANALTGSFHRLSSCSEALWSIGTKSALKFDGTTWQRLV